MGEDWGRYPKKKCKAEIVLPKKINVSFSGLFCQKTTHFGVSDNTIFGDRIVQYAVISGHLSIIPLSRIMARFLN